MRPFRSFLLLLVLLVCLTGLSCLFPGTGLFPSLGDLLPDITLPVLCTGNGREARDSTHSFITGSAHVTADDTLLSGTVNDTIVPSVTYPVKGQFYDSLKFSGGPVRIMYYGDSQTEGDRISSYLRELLRKERGGTGPGLFLPLMPVMYTRTIWVRSSANWKKYNYLSYKKGELSHTRLGPFMAVCRYLPEGKVSPVTEKAYVRIKPSKFADSLSSVYDVLRVFYTNKTGRVMLTVRTNKGEVFRDSLKNGMSIHELSYNLSGAAGVMAEFEGRTSPDIYAMSIEGSSGIILDNIPQRGSAGLEFTMVDKQNLEESFRLLSPELIILNYGLNVVKSGRNDYSYYKSGIERQLMLLKEIVPSASLLLAGVTDMAAKRGDSIVSFRNIPSIIIAQQEAAMDAGITFWDSYKAMGGRSSIIAWAKRKPPLAQTDYTHFTYTGADTMSLMMYKDLFTPKKSGTVLSADIQPAKPDAFVTGITEKQNKKNLNMEPESRFRVLVSHILTYDPDKPFIFTSAAFWIFFLLVLAGYGIVYRKLFIRNFYLLLISLFFYYKSGGFFLGLLLFVTVIDFTCGIMIHRSEKKFFRVFFILLSLVSNLGLLGYFKYTGFIIHSINDLLGMNIKVYDFLASFSNMHLGTRFSIDNIILPVGISFFTFQSLSYTIDIYRRKISPVKNIIDFGFYVSFFPQLVAGPIVRASEFIPQLYKKYSLTNREFSHALFLISKGLIKKMLISDFIAINFIDRVFNLPGSYSGFENLMAVYGYGLQIYCDFSGYTDIAIGLGLIMGFRLPVNFNSPYKASGISDFWKRWHISLSRWLKDYLYISLGGNRKGRIRTGINLFITMLIGGLWHGADLRFVIWGGLHGTGLVINKIWHSIFNRKLRKGWFGRAVSVFITFNFVSFCWIFFRAHDSETALVMLRQILHSFSPGSYATVLPAYSTVFLVILTGYIIHFLPEKIKESYRGLFIRMPLVFRLTAILIVAVLLYQMRSTETMPFIYFRF